MYNEKELVQGVLEGNEYAYRRFVKQYERLVFHVIIKIIDQEEDAEDLAQEIFMKVFKKLSSFKFQSKVSTWIVQIAYRDAINYLKKNKRYTDNKVDINKSYALADSAQNPEELNISKDLSFLVNEAIKHLPKHYRDVLVLHHLDEFSYPEIGEITGLPEGTVKNYIFRARKLLKEHLAPYLKREQL